MTPATAAAMTPATAAAMTPATAGTTRAMAAGCWAGWWVTRLLPSCTAPTPRWGAAARAPGDCSAASVYWAASGLVMATAGSPVSANTAAVGAPVTDPVGVDPVGAALVG